MKIELTETEIIHIMDSLRLRCQDLRDCDDAESTDLANELEDLEHDLFEASARPADWTEDLEPTEIVICDAETRMFNAGVEAREQMKERNRLMDLLDSQGGRSIELAEQIDQLDAQMKASSRAAERRALNFSAARDDGDLSETQKHDLWEKPSNDPVDW
jgi:hypothetical protein